MKPCLIMIVRNEAPIIGRCLASVRDHISRWVIVDTGSTDETEAEVQKALVGIDGVFHRTEWRGFGDARTTSLNLAEALMFGIGYALSIDADEELHLADGFEWPKGLDAYAIQMNIAGHTWPMKRLLRLGRGWRFEGALHEYPTSDQKMSIGDLDGVTLTTKRDGARSRNPNKYRDDALTLEAELEKDPTNTRNVFYCAQSWRDAGEFAKAIAWYEQRATMGGWDEEVFVSLFEVAKCKERAGFYVDEVVAAYKRAIDARPTRAEGYVELARFYRVRGMHDLAGALASVALHVPRPTDVLFVDEASYTWRPHDELALAHYAIGDFPASASVCRYILETYDVPEPDRARIEANLRYALMRAA